MPLSLSLVRTNAPQALRHTRFASQPNPVVLSFTDGTFSPVQDKYQRRFPYRIQLLAGSKNGPPTSVLIAYIPPGQTMITPLRTLNTFSYQLQFPIHEGLLGDPLELNHESFLTAHSLVEYPDKTSVFKPHARQVAKQALQEYKPSPTPIRPF